MVVGKGGGVGGVEKRGLWDEGGRRGRMVEVTEGEDGEKGGRKVRGRIR